MHWHDQFLHMLLKRGPLRNLIPKIWAYLKTIVIEQYWTSEYKATSPLMKYKKVQNSRTVSKTWFKKLLTWFGHVCCLNDESLQKWMMKEDFNNKRNRGRSKKRWIDLIKKDNRSQWQPLIIMQRIERNGKQCKH